MINQVPHGESDSAAYLTNTEVLHCLFLHTVGI
jgi:hypothetical protein